MIAFEKMARKHWEKNLPRFVKELKKEGIYERELKTAARQASEELAHLVKDGAQVEAAKEIVLMEYILLDPKTIE